MSFHDTDTNQQVTRIWMDLPSWWSKAALKGRRVKRVQPESLPVEGRATTWDSVTVNWRKRKTSYSNYDTHTNSPSRDLTCAIAPAIVNWGEKKKRFVGGKLSSLLTFSCATLRRTNRIWTLHTCTRRIWTLHTCTRRICLERVIIRSRSRRSGGYVPASVAYHFHLDNDTISGAAQLTPRLIRWGSKNLTTN